MTGQIYPCYSFSMNFLMILSAKYLYLVIIGIAVIYTLFQTRKIQKKILLFAVVSLPLSYILAKIAGKLYYDPRPFVAHHFTPLIPHAASNGFPSDHTLISFAIASLLFVFNKKLGIVAGVLGLLVGVARVYVGVHSPIDIAGAIVIAIISALIVDQVLARFFRFGL